MKRIFFFKIFLFILLSVNAQPQQTLIRQLTVLEYSHFTDIKGRFVSEDADGDAYYRCLKPLLGFTTMIVQHKGIGKMYLRAVPNSNAPRPPMLEKLLDQLNRSVGMLGVIKKDSDSDAALKEWLKKLPKIQRIIIYAQKEDNSLTIYISKEDDYMIEIANKY